VTENGDPETRSDPMALQQGGLGLLWERDVARRLHSSRIAARVADMAIDGTPPVDTHAWGHS
jgi:hypothetical protein